MGAECVECGQEQGAVGRHGQWGLLGHGDGVPQLGLANTQGIFFFPVVHFNLPAVEVNLEQLIRTMREAGAK